MFASPARSWFLWKTCHFDPAFAALEVYSQIRLEGDLGALSSPLPVGAAPVSVGRACSSHHHSFCPLTRVWTAGRNRCIGYRDGPSRRNRHDGVHADYAATRRSRSRADDDRRAYRDHRSYGGTAIYLYATGGCGGTDGDSLPDLHIRHYQHQ